MFVDGVRSFFIIRPSATEIQLRPGEAEIRVPPGTHKLEIPAAGVVPETRDVTVAAGERLPIYFAFVPEPKLKPGETTEAFEWKGEKRTRRVRTINLGGEKLELVRIKAGQFTMGSNESPDEQPVHQVTLTKDFYIGKIPVTAKQFAAFAAATKYRQRVTVSGLKDGDPAIVNHEEAAAFCNWATKEVKRTVALPTERNGSTPAEPAPPRFTSPGTSPRAWKGTQTSQTGR